MAVIEERILCSCYRGIQAKLMASNNVGMTRQEAIRKMCDAYFKAKDKGVMESERVEAALNALLEGVK